MFKTIFNTINGHQNRQSRDQAPEAAGEPANGLCKSQAGTVSHGQDIMGQENSGASKKKNLSGKGKKKLAAMMGRIQSTMGQQQTGARAKADHDKLSGLLKHASLSDRDDSEAETETETEADADEYESLADAGTFDERGIDSKHDLQYQRRLSAGSGENAIGKLDEKQKFVLPEEECDIPTFLHTKNCDQKLIAETRRLLKERYAKNPDNFYPNDYKRMLNDDWTVSRFLLRRRLDPKRTVKLMEECGRFRKQYKMSEVQLWEFPIEFHRAGGLFTYATDRVGNNTVYMRVKMYRRVPEISDVFKAFILCVLELSDSSNGGRGTAVVFDLTSCGLQNVDLGFLSWLLSSFRNYCPKGVSYILVYNLPWILNATCKLAMTWMSASNRRSLRFAQGAEIENYIAPENLPDYLGGSCKIDYRTVPEGSKPATEVCGRLEMTPEQALKIRELFKEYLLDEDCCKDDSDHANNNHDDNDNNNNNNNNNSKTSDKKKGNQKDSAAAAAAAAAAKTKTKSNGGVKSSKKR